MHMFTTPNAIKIALMQVGVIVAGILAAGIGYRAASDLERVVPVSTVFLVHFGFLLLALPLVWIGVAMRMQRNATASDRRKSLTFLAGLALLIGLILLALHAAGTPWMGGSLWLRSE